MAYELRFGPRYSAWEVAREIIVRWPQLLIPALVGMGGGGICLLIADIHERLERRG
ncbi:hypothetical protein [Brevundimonas sp.]|uniref:hypothetical protein n=1 Tax=Brevundimonas sp. TaxID=1871086 RepID=UPI0025F48A95|nr:hypothetical protein [Brevundimonas sp.]